MALTPCPDCGAELASTARTCPHCGTRNLPARRTHARTWLWSAAVLMAVAIPGTVFGVRHYQNEQIAKRCFEEAMVQGGNEDNAERAYDAARFYMRSCLRDSWHGSDYGVAWRERCSTARQVFAIMIWTDDPTTKLVLTGDGLLAWNDSALDAERARQSVEPCS